MEDSHRCCMSTFALKYLIAPTFKAQCKLKYGVICKSNLGPIVLSFWWHRGEKGLHDYVARTMVLG